MTFGIGQEAEYLRSANQIITIMNYITGAAGGKPKDTNPDDIYPQLAYKKKRPGNNLIDWDKTPERLRKEFVAAGLFTEDGMPKGYNPHGGNNRS